MRNVQGQLQIRYQLPSEDKVFTSDWTGQCEVRTRLDIKERHTPSYRIDRKKGRLLVDEKVSYSGSMKTPEFRFRGYYELNEAGDELWLHCESVKQGRKEFQCPRPFVYQRVSDSTEWPEK
jgi:hypothetical protein